MTPVYRINPVYRMTPVYRTTPVYRMTPVYRITPVCCMTPVYRMTPEHRMTTVYPWPKCTLQTLGSSNASRSWALTPLRRLLSATSYLKLSRQITCDQGEVKTILKIWLPQYWSGKDKKKNSLLKMYPCRKNHPDKSTVLCWLQADNYGKQ